MTQKVFQAHHVHLSGFKELDRPGMPPGMGGNLVSLYTEFFTVPDHVLHGSPAVKWGSDPASLQEQNLRKSGRQQPGA